MKQTKKRKKWMKFRHRVVRNLAFTVLRPYSCWRYGITVEPFREQGDRQYLIMMNHQTVFDQFFVGMAFRGPVYYIATEDLFSNGWVSHLIRYLVEPIPIKKQTTDLKAVKNCLQVAKEGGTIALAPEGNRTYSGKTEYIKPSIVKLARALKLPLAFFRIEDGYGIQPRWSDVLRKGKMRAGVSRVVEPEEYAALSDEELYALIQRELYVNEASVSGTFYHKNCAEYLERAVYVCPYCGLSVFESHGDTVTCKTCGRQVRYLPTKEFEGIGFAFPFRFVGDWYAYQCDFVNALDPAQYLETPMYCDTANMSEVVLYRRKQPLRQNAALALYGDRITVDDLVFPFRETAAVTVLGRNKLNIYFDEKVYQFKGDKRFNALKYVNLYHRYKNVSEGNADGKFLGL